MLCGEKPMRLFTTQDKNKLRKLKTFMITFQSQALHQTSRMRFLRMPPTQ